MKKIIYLILALIAVFAYLFWCTRIPANINAEKEIVLECPPTFIFQTMVDFKAWKKWMQWSKGANYTFDIGGRERNIGANAKFDQTNLGKGDLEITEAYKDSIITIDIKASKLPFPVFYNCQIIPENNKRTMIRWKINSKQKIPFLLRPFYYDADNLIEEQLEKDAKGMQNYMTTAFSTNFGIRDEQFKGMKVFGKIGVVLNPKVPQFYAKELPGVYRAMDSMGIEVKGATTGLIMDWDATQDYVYMIAGFQVDQKFKVPLKYELRDISPGPAFVIDHYGSYATLRNAHALMDYFLRNTIYTIRAPIIEEYVTNPATEPDTSKWLTRITYLVNTDPATQKKQQPTGRTMEEMIKEEQERQRREIEQFNK